MIKVAAACSAAALVLAGCGSSDDEVTEIRMGYVPWIGYGGWFIAEEEGYFADAGLDVEMISFNSDAEKNNALAAGQIDMLNIASHGALQLLANDVDLSIVLLMDLSTTADAIIAGEDITSISDLAGLEIAYEQITTSDLLLNYALLENGMTIDDIVQVPMAAFQAGTALVAGQADVAVTYEPYISEVLASEDGIELLYTAGEAPGLISDVLVVRNDFLAEHPDAVQALVDTWGQGMDFYAADEAAGQEIIANGVGSDIESLATAFDGVQFFNLEENREMLRGEYADTVLPMVQDATVSAGILDGEVEFIDAIDDTFVNADS